MFGYVNVFKDELKIKDYYTYRAYYCGLCKALGENFNQISRLGLNYDFAFLALLADSLCKDDAKFLKQSCVKHFSKKHLAVSCDNKAIEYSSYMSIILTYFKLKDDLNDSFSIKALLAIIPYYFSAKKAKIKYREKYNTIEKNLKELSFLEKENCDIIDKAAHPFSVIMQHLFEFDFCQSAPWLGYNIGRFIYIIDAYDDIKHDLKHNNFNPIINAYKIKNDDDIYLAKDDMERSLLYTLSVVADEYEKLKIYKNKEILDNIIYLGLRYVMDKTLNERKNLEHEKSL